MYVLKVSRTEKLIFAQEFRTMEQLNKFIARYLAFKEYDNWRVSRNDHSIILSHDNVADNVVITWRETRG